MAATPFPVHVSTAFRVFGATAGLLLVLIAALRALRPDMTMAAAHAVMGMHPYDELIAQLRR